MENYKYTDELFGGHGLMCGYLININNNHINMLIWQHITVEVCICVLLQHAMRVDHMHGR